MSLASTALRRPVTTVAATDADLPAQTIGYSLSGPDLALFAFDATTGEIRFRASPDFENPADGDHDNIYRLTATANDGNGGITTQDISITVLKNPNDKHCQYGIKCGPDLVFTIANPLNLPQAVERIHKHIDQIIHLALSITSSDRETMRFRHLLNELARAGTPWWQRIW